MGFQPPRQSLLRSIADVLARFGEGLTTGTAREVDQCVPSFLREERGVLHLFHLNLTPA
jgi:hypothetical protein